MMEKLSWWQWLMFGLATLVALAIGWWSMFTLGVETFHMPEILAGSISAAFDVGALFLGSISIKYAISDESGTSVKLATYIFVGLSAWVNWMHAELLNLPIVGMVFFSAAPIMSGILLHVILTYLNKKQLSEKNKTVRALPNPGILTWILKPAASFALLKEALNYRLRTSWVAHVTNEKLTAQDIEKASAIENSFDNYRSQPVKAVATVEKPIVRRENTPEIVENTLTSQVDEIFSYEKPENSQISHPENLPHFLSHGMSVNKVAALCFENGISDLDVVFEYAKMVNENVEKSLVSKSLSRARNKK